MVKRYHILNEYNHWKSRITTPPSDRVAFAQNNTKRSNDQNNDDWEKIATYHKCGKKGHIRPKLPNKNINRYTDDESTNKDQKKVRKKAAKTNLSNLCRTCCCCCWYCPLAREVCPNYEVAGFQPRTLTTPDLGSVAYFYIH